MYLNDLVKFTGFFNDTFSPNDPCSNAYSLGQRRVLLRILSFIGRNDAQEMIKNSIEKEKINE